MASWESNMESELQELALKILDEHRIMCIATNRNDGWPQATMVGYANSRLFLYFFVARLSQKFANIKRDPRVSITVGSDFSDPAKIRGLSMAGTASIVTARDECDRAEFAFLERFPEFKSWPRPNFAVSSLMKISPKVFSIIDYSKGFGHSDLIMAQDGTLRDVLRHGSHWLGHSK
jgi:nitroimidazol reductase NimA-like FMN-containing flavoprotein (pyridoxamine 5'-phosphate oxidase superfamily)